MGIMSVNTFKWIGMLSSIFFVPAILLSLSFFILCLNRKCEGCVLKLFGRLIVMLLWVTCALSFTYGIYSVYMSSKMKNSMTEEMKEKGKIQQRGIEEGGIYVK